MRELWFNILHTSGARIYSLLTGIFLLFITARLLGPEGRGQVAAITTWVAFFSTFAYCSLGQVAVHRMAQEPEHTRFGQLLGSLGLLALTLTIVGWATAICLHLLLPDHIFKGLPTWPLVVGFAALPLLIWEQYGSSLLAGLNRVRVYNRYQVLGRTLTLLAAVVLVGLAGRGVTGVLEATLIGQVIVASGGAGLLLSYAREKSSHLMPSLKEMRVLLLGGAKLHLNAIGTFMTTSVNVLILNHYYDATVVGNFQLASQLLSVLMILPQAASVAIVGKVATLGPDASWPQNRSVLLHVSIMMAVISIIAALLAPLAIPLLAGAAFASSVRPFQWMLLGLIGLTFSAVMAPQWIGRGYFLQVAALTFLIGILNLGGNLWLIPLFGVDGAVGAFVATYLFSVVANGLMAWHCEVRHRSWLSQADRRSSFNAHTD